MSIMPIPAIRCPGQQRAGAGDPAMHVVASLMAFQPGSTRRAVSRVLLAIHIVAGTAAPVSACINDSDSSTQESQFRSAYAQLPVPASQRGWNAVGVGITIAGAGLIAACMYLAFSSTPRRP